MKTSNKQLTSLKDRQTAGCHQQKGKEIPIDPIMFILLVIFFLDPKCLR